MVVIVTVLTLVSILGLGIAGALSSHYSISTIAQSLLYCLGAGVLWVIFLIWSSVWPLWRAFGNSQDNHFNQNRGTG